MGIGLFGVVGGRDIGFLYFVNIMQYTMYLRQFTFDICIHRIVHRNIKSDSLGGRGVLSLVY